MATEAPVNGVQTTLASPYITSTGQTTFNITSATGFANAQYHILVTDGTNYEIMLVSGQVSSVLTVTRAVESYGGVQTAYTFGAGTTVSIVPSVQSVKNVIAQTGIPGTNVANVVVAVTQSATPAIDTDNGTIFEVFNLAQAITSLTTNLTGTPVDGQQICVAFSDNGTARAITYGANFVNQGATAPTTTVVGDTTYTYWIYSSAATAWIFQYANVAASGGSSGLITQVNANTSGTFTAAIGDEINLTSSATITLPASPTIGKAVLVNFPNAWFNTTTITANTGQTINGGTSGGSVSVVYQGSSPQLVTVLFIATSSTTWITLASGTDLGGGLAVTNFAASVASFGYTSTASGATATTPTFANGTASQLANTNKDAMVYLTVGTAGTAMTIAIGPTSTPANTVVSSSPATAGQVYSIRLPAGWYLKWSATTATIANQLAVSC